MSLYEILGVGEGATPAQIKAAWRKVSRIHHPDKGGDAETFKQVKLAYEVLSDEKRRAQYDKSGVFNNGVDNQQSEMYSALVTIVTRVIEEINDPTSVDVIATSKMFLQKGVEEGTKFIRTYHRSIKKREQVIGRLKVKEGPNILAEALQAQVAQLEEDIERVREQMDNNIKMMELLDTYSYELTTDPTFRTWPTLPLY